MKWEPSGSGDETNIDIDPSSPRLLRIFLVKENESRIHCSIPRMAAKYKRLFDQRSTDPFKFDIMVIGDGIVPERMSLKIQLGQHWDDLRVEQIGGEDEPQASD